MKKSIDFYLKNKNGKEGNEDARRCPNCSAHLADDSLFCSKCGTPISEGNVCPHCGAVINEGDVFCENCGCKLKEEEADYNKVETAPQAKCPYCGNPTNDGDVFCQNCGTIFKTHQTVAQAPQIDTEFDITEYDNTPQRRAVSNVIIGVIIVVLLGGSYWWYNDYSEKKTIRIEREKFLADSLEKVRKDLINLAEQKEKERQDSIARAEELKPIQPYLDVLAELANMNEDFEYAFYFLYDINNDNFPELWVQSLIIDDDDLKLLVYSSKNGRIQRLYKGNVGHPAHHSFHQGDNYILFCFAHMGSEIWDKYEFVNGKINKETIWEPTYDSMEEAYEHDYREIEEPQVTTYSLTDTFPIYEIIENKY